MREFMLLLLFACAHHIAPLATPAAPLPAASAPSALAVCRVEFATSKLPHGMVVARGRLKQDVEGTASGLLLIHPNGTWLIDGGIAEAFNEHLSDVRGFFGFAIRQSAKGWTRVATPVEAIRRVGGDPAALTGAIATHSHYDHLGGLLDIPDVPIWLPSEEIAVATDVAAGEPGSINPASEARALLPRARPIVFSGAPLGPWASSWDLFGDGSAQVFPMPGHTPGSVGVYVHLADGRRVLAVGDTVWVREGYEAREPKSWIAENFDSDGADTRLQIATLAALHAADPGLLILPAHDRRQWQLAFPNGDCVR